jgi:hypothetical protein
MSIVHALSCSAVALAIALGTPGVADASGTAGRQKPTGTGRTRKPAGTAKPAARTRAPRAATGTGRAASALAATRAPRAASATRAVGPRPTRAAATRGATRGAPRLTRVERETAAVRGVRDVLRPWVRGTGVGVEARLAIQQIQISSHNKLLGRGPVDVIVSPRVTKRTTRWQRFISAFRPSVNRRMLMAVNEYGNATVLDDEPDAIQHRMARAITSRIPIPEILSDVLRSKQSQAGLVGAAGSVLAFTVNPALGAAGLVTAGGFILNGRRERTAQRNAAFGRTMTWARAREKDGNRPALSEMHRYYSLQLQNSSTRPITMRQFVERLSLEDFDGDGNDVATDAPPVE